MIENVFIREEAERLGIEVSQEEVEAFIAETMFQYYPDGTPTPAPTDPVFPTPTFSALQMTLTAPTTTAVITETTAVESEAVEPEDTSDLAESVDSGEVEPAPTEVLPTPTIYTESAYNQNYKDFISYIRNYARVSEADIYEIYENFILRERVAEAVITDIPLEEEKLWARHILFQDPETGEGEARAFLDRIEAGEDFVTVAEELATVLPEPVDEETAPAPTVIFEDLGWFGEGTMVDPFDQAARLLSIGEISQPIQTDFGWHIIQLLGRDVQPRSQADIDQLREQAFQEWLTALRLENEVNITQDWVSAVPLEPDIPETIKIQGATTAQ
jgi:parvulin-like peptidyl-prolyl isomerase